jgi:glutaminyl-peptide cyclotransferase
MRRMSGQNVYLAAVLIGSGLLMGYVFLFYGSDPELAARGPRGLAQIPFDGAAAYKNLLALCDLGSRRSGTEGMSKQQKLITEHFERLGAKVERQEFRVRHPLDGSAVSMTNLIVHWHPERRERLLVCAHYDTRPYPDRDAKNPRGLFVGANDGASGAALMMELGRSMPGLAGPLGVDFVLFDGEELVYGDNDEYFLGAKHFAQQYVAEPPPYRYRAGVLLDMVGDANLRCLYEPNSVKFAPQVVREIWDTAHRLGVREFVPQTMPTAVNDDHIPLNEIANIPTCDVIDFDYPYWHTTGDVPSRCSALSLAKVGWVIQEWLKGAVAGRTTR